MILVQECAGTRQGERRAQRARKAHRLRTGSASGRSLRLFRYEQRRRQVDRGLKNRQIALRRGFYSDRQRKGREMMAALMPGSLSRHGTTIVAAGMLVGRRVLVSCLMNMDRRRFVFAVGATKHGRYRCRHPLQGNDRQ